MHQIIIKIKNEAALQKLEKDLGVEISPTLEVISFPSLKYRCVKFIHRKSGPALEAGACDLWGEPVDIPEKEHEWQKWWHGTLDFYVEDAEKICDFEMQFESVADRDAFASLIGQKITEKTRNIWLPKRPTDNFKKVYYEHEPQISDLHNQ